MLKYYADKKQALSDFEEQAEQDFQKFCSLPIIQQARDEPFSGYQSSYQQPSAPEIEPEIEIDTAELAQKGAFLINKCYILK